MLLFQSSLVLLIIQLSKAKSCELNVSCTKHELLKIMPFPEKFKNLLEIENKDVETPSYLWLTYAVCATSEQSCGWGGWMIEAVFKKTKDNFPTSTGDKILPAIDDQICPRCNRETYRTGVTLKYDFSKEQKFPLAEGENYIGIPPKFE